MVKPGVHNGRSGYFIKKFDFENAELVKRNNDEVYFIPHKYQKKLKEGCDNPLVPKYDEEKVLLLLKQNMKKDEIVRTAGISMNQLNYGLIKKYGTSNYRAVLIQMNQTN